MLWPVLKKNKNGPTCVDLNHIDFYCIDKNSSSKYFLFRNKKSNMAQINIKIYKSAYVANSSSQITSVHIISHIYPLRKLSIWWFRQIVLTELFIFML